MTQAQSFVLLAAKTTDDLSRIVNEHLADGWRLYGKPFANGDCLYQAVILKRAGAKRLRKTSEDG